LIDLGTTTRASLYWKRRSESYRNSEGARTTPSIIALPVTTNVVGQSAKRQAVTTRKYIIRYQRLIGRALRMMLYKRIKMVPTKLPKQKRRCVGRSHGKKWRHRILRVVDKLKKDPKLFGRRSHESYYRTGLF